MRIFISTLPFVFLVQSILAKPLADGDTLVKRNISLPTDIKLPRDLPDNMTIPRSHVEVPAKESNGHFDTGNSHNESQSEEVGNVKGYKTTTRLERRQEPSANVSTEAHPDNIKSIDLTTRRALEQAEMRE